MRERQAGTTDKSKSALPDITQPAGHNALPNPTQQL